METNSTMTQTMTTSDQNRYSITLAAPSLAELALLIEQVSDGLGRHTAKPGVPLRSFQWRPEEEETIRSMKAEGASWDAIGDVLGRTPKAVKLRWARIRPAD